MLSRFSIKWRWYDWIFAAVVFLIIVGLVRIVAPNSGFSISLHNAFHSLSNFCLWIAAGLTSLATTLNLI